MDKIGDFNFINLSRPAELPQQQLAVRSRPGVNGVMVQQLGIRGSQFQVTSVVDSLNITDAHNQYLDYTQIVGGSPVRIIWANQQYFSENILFFVLKVEPLLIRQIVRGHGGLLGASYARCQCVWTLQPTQV